MKADTRVTVPQAGFGLIEVMVSMAILGIALLGLIILQAKAQQIAMDTYQRSQSLIILDDMVSRLYANAIAAQSCYLTDRFAKLPGEWSDTDTEYRGCSDASNRDLAEWNASLQGTGERITENNQTRIVGAILAARGCVTQDPTDPDLLHVSVAWQGLHPMPAPANPCAADRFDAADLRRVVSVPVRLSHWK